VFDIDLAETVNGAIAYLKANSKKTIFQTIIAEMGITESEEEVVESIMASVEELCADNPTLVTFINRLVAFINTELEPENQINIIEICSALEAEGLNAVAFYEMVNYFVGFEVLPAPEAEMSLVDYLDYVLSGIRVDDLAKLVNGSEDATFVSVVARILQLARQTTLGDIIYEGFDVDFETLNFAFDDLYANATLTTDSSSRLTSLHAEYNVGFSTYDEEEGQTAMFSMACFTIEISYEAFATEIAIPQAVLEML
jgi:hypothetical protein